MGSFLTLRPSSPISGHVASTSPAQFDDVAGGKDTFLSGALRPGPGFAQRIGLRCMIYRGSRLSLQNEL